MARPSLTETSPDPIRDDVCLQSRRMASLSVTPVVVRQAASLAWLAHGVLAALVLAVYAQTIGFDFVDFDDPGYLFDLKRVARGLTFENVWWSFTVYTRANYHPLTWVSYFADVSLFGMNPAGFHFTNVVLHLANTLLLFSLLSRMTGDRQRSFLVAALFGIHPLHAESVAWISERKDVLSTLFALGAIGAYVRWVRVPRRSTWWWLLVLMLLSLLAKQTMVTLPCVLILLDFWPLNRLRPIGGAPTDEAPDNPRITLWQSIREKWSLFLMSVVFCVSVVIAQASAGTVASIKGISLQIRVGNAILSYAVYLRKVFWPMDLAFFYAHPRENLDWGHVAAAAVVLAIVTLACWLSRKRNPAALIGWLWYIGTLLPMIGIVQVGAQALADRYMYVPLIGVSILLAWCIPNRWITQTRSRRALQAACGVILILLTIQGWRQAATWRNTYTMSEHALSLNPENDVAHSQRGYRLMKDGRIPEAEFHFQEGIRINPTRRIECYYNMGFIREERGDFEEAIEWYRLTIEKRQRYQPARRGMGAALLGLNRLDDAGREIAAGLELFPRSPSLWHLKGRWHALRGEVDEARAALHKALEIDPEHEEAIEELQFLQEDASRA